MKYFLLLFLFFFSMFCFAQNKTVVGKVLQPINLSKSNCKTELITCKALPNNPDETIVVIPEMAEENYFGFALNSHIFIVDSSTEKLLKISMERVTRR